MDEFSFTRLIVEDMLFHWNLLQGCTRIPDLTVTSWRFNRQLGLEDPGINRQVKDPPTKGVPINLYDWRARRLSDSLSSHEIDGVRKEK